jgi:hypothetical protein
VYLDPSEDKLSQTAASVNLRRSNTERSKIS